MKYIPWVVAILAPVSFVLLTHNVIKLAEEPAFGDPANIYNNYVIALEVVPVPFPPVTAIFILVLQGYVAYRLTYWLLRRLSPKGNNTAA